MTTNHDDNGDYALMSGNDPLDGLLREWHAENAGSAATQRDKLLNAISANAETKSRFREQLPYTAQAASCKPGASAAGLSISNRSTFARFTPAIAASLAFAATLGLLFTTVGPRATQARADVIMTPDGGRLDAVNAKGELIGPCPLQHTDVHVDVSGSFARVTLKQRYGNPYADKIEAVYTFPMSHRAAVDRMTMTIGQRVVVGEVKEREAARATYEAARNAGHAAALLEQERPNIFTQSVANVEPGVEIVVEISYVELLEARDGLFGFTFPMVVAPRYILGGDDSSKPLPAGLQHREGLNLLAPGTLAITANGDTSQNGVLTAEVIHTLVTEAVPIEAPPAEYWTAHYPTTGQPALWHQFEAGYLDGQREAGVLYTDGLGQINGRWFYIDAGGAPKSAAGTGFASGTAQVPDAARITPQPVKPPTRAGHDISISVNIDTGGPGITDLESKLHTIRQNWDGMRTDGTPSQVAVSLNDAATIPNQDFVLNWRQTADTITEQVFTHAGPRGNFITLILNPPARVENTQAVPRELIFLLDTSGSMQGFPIQKAKEVMSKAIAALRPQDTFNLITFSGDTNILWDAPQPASPDKLAEAQQFLESREGRGGTEMMKAIEAALTVRAESRQLAPGEAAPVRIVCFMTDGEVGNDMQIIDAVKNNAATTRVFSFGIGNSVNRYLLDGIAKAGRGAAEYVLLSEGADEKVASFSQRIQSPVLMDVQMEFSEGLEIVDGVSSGVDSMTDGNSSSPTEGGRYALVLPDLYDVAPVIVHARYTKGGKGSVTLRGNAGDGPYEKMIELDLPDAKPEHDVIATLWARERVEQIMNRDLAAAQAGKFPEDLKKQVIDLGESFQIMTQFTSFVAVENLRVTIGGQPRLVPVPIEMPEGQSWEGTTGEAVNKWAEQIAPQELATGTVDVWSLVRANNSTPKQFNCPSATDSPEPVQDTTAYYDFLTEVNLSYAYQYQADPINPALGDGSDPTFPLMAGANPYVSQNVANQATATKLQQLTGEINLDGVSFEQTINHLRDLSGVNISVDWNALQTAAIDRDSEVSLHIHAGTVKMETVLKMLLEEVGGGEVEMASKATNGVLQISTKEALESRTTVEAYNVQDLIRRVEEFESNAGQSNYQEPLLEIVQEDSRILLRGTKAQLADAAKLGNALRSGVPQTGQPAEALRRNVVPQREDGETLYFEAKQITPAEGLPNAPPGQPGPILHGLEKQPFPATDSRVAGAEQPVLPSGGPESTYWFNVRTTERRTVATAGQPTTSTHPKAPGMPPPPNPPGVVTNQFGSAEYRPHVFGLLGVQPAPAEEGAGLRKATNDDFVIGSRFASPRNAQARVGYVAMGQGGVPLYDVNNSASQNATTIPDAGGASIPTTSAYSYDSNGDGIADMTLGTPVLGDIPALGRALPSDEATQFRLNLNMKPHQPLDALAAELAGNKPAFAYAPAPAPSEPDLVVACKGIDALLLEVVDDQDPVELGQEITYTITVTNQGTQTYSKIALNVVLPQHVRPIRCSGGPAQREGQTIRFMPQATLEPKKRLQRTLTVRPVMAGDQRITVYMSNAEMKGQPVMETESSQFDAVGGESQLSPEAIADIDRQWIDGTVMPEESARLTKNGPASDVAHVRPSSRRLGDSPADQVLLDQLLVRAAALASAGRMEASVAVVEAILKARPAPSPLGAEGDQGGSPKVRVSVGDSSGRGEGAFAVASAMREALTNGVITPQACVARVCELAAGAAKRLAATAERARTLAKRLDERLLRLAIGDAAAVRTPRGNGGQSAESAYDNLDIKDGGVLVTVLVDAFGDGTVAALTMAGLAIESTSKPTRVVIGRVAPQRLANLATSKHVRRVEAVRIR